MTTGNAPDGKLYAGKPHVRLDEGEVASSATPRRGALLCNKLIVATIAMSAVFAAAAVPAEAKSATAGKEKIAKTSKEVNENVGKSEADVKSERAINDKLSKIRIPHFKIKEGTDLIEVIEMLRVASKKYDIEPGKPGILFSLDVDGEIPRMFSMKADNIALGDIFKLVLLSVDCEYKVYGNTVTIFKKK